METIISAIGSLGFPVVICLILGVVIKQMLENYRTDINTMSQKYVEDVKELNEKYQEALVNNTVAIEKLTSVVAGIDKRLSRLENIKEDEDELHS